MTDINVGAISEALNNKMDRDYNNASKPYLKIAYVNGTSGYNIWSNGYCEQWGRNQGVASSDGVTVTFIKTFSNTNYNVVCSLQTGSDVTSNVYSARQVLSRKTVNSANFLTTYSGGYGAYAFDWRACGYLASGQY